MPINVIDIIKPANNGQFPSHEDVDGYGGFQVRQDLADRDSIPAANRKVGMMVYVISDSTFYQLNAPNTWIKASFSKNLSGSSLSVDNIYVDGYTANYVDLSAYTEPSPQPFIHIKFDEPEGSTTFANTGTSSSLMPVMVTNSDIWGTSKMYSSSSGNLFGGALWSNGEMFQEGFGSSVTTSNFASNPGSEITVSCWVYLTEYHGASGRYNAIVHKKYNSDMGDWGDTAPQVSFELSTYVPSPYVPGSWFARVGIGTGMYDTAVIIASDPSNVIPLNTWCFIALTYSKTQGQLKSYFNGNLVGTSSVSGNKDIAYSDGAYYVGYSPAHTAQPWYPFKPIPGFIDDVRIESVVRDQAYLQALYNKALTVLNQDSINRSETLEIVDTSTNYPKNSRIYAETLGNQTFLQNAKWLPNTNKWHQENPSLPSSIISLGVSNGRYYTEHSKKTTIGISTKDPSSSDWTNSQWDSSAFNLEVGTTKFLNDTSKTINYAKLSLGPKDGVPGYGSVVLNGNTYRGSTPDSQGGPFIQINGPPPSALNTLHNSLYSSNIPKGIVSFHGIKSVDNVYSTTYYGENVLNSFNIYYVDYGIFPLDSIGDGSVITQTSVSAFKICFQTSISYMTPMLSISTNILPAYTNIPSLYQTRAGSYTPSIGTSKPIIVSDRFNPNNILWVIFMTDDHFYTDVPLTPNIGTNSTSIFYTPTINLTVFGLQ